MPVIFESGLKTGLNCFYAAVKTKHDFVDIYKANNQQRGPVIKPDSKITGINGLFIVYDNLNFDNTDISLNETDIANIEKRLEYLKSFLWKHTESLVLNVERKTFTRDLTMNDFTVYDEKGGYIIAPERVESDIAESLYKKKHDFIYALYPWSNTIEHWVGYHGYVFQEDRRIMMGIPLAAQPITHNNVLDDEVAAHEMLHILETYTEKNTDFEFYSPDDRETNTTFTSELDYYIWMLESWPTERWAEMMQEKSANVSADVEFSKTQPSYFSLNQNYPNPFNNTTTIRYSLPVGDNSGSVVTLKIFSVLGVCVKTLVQGKQSFGEHTVEWDGTDNLGHSVPSGMYFYQLSYAKHMENRKLLLLK
jgi:hypothetical protein